MVDKLIRYNTQTNRFDVASHLRAVFLNGKK
jgi:hypothetical protein